MIFKISLNRIMKGNGYTGMIPNKRDMKLYEIPEERINNLDEKLEVKRK